MFIYYYLTTPSQLHRL